MLKNILTHSILISALTLRTYIAQAQTIAFTFDDGSSLKETPLLSPEERNQTLLDTLAKNKIQAALFVTATNGANQHQGLALAKSWGLAGHAIANHTMTHPDKIIYFINRI